MNKSQRLLDFYLPPAEGFILESLVATTYQVDFEFFEEELLASALGVRAPVSRVKAFRSELERRLQKTDVSILYDLRACDRLTRFSPRIDPIPIVGRKLHAKISLLMWVRTERDGNRRSDRLLRLIVGSANLTRQGFRQNYECISVVDYGGRSKAPKAHLMKAIMMLSQIGAESDSPQLARQIEFFQKIAEGFPNGKPGKREPLALVTADEVIQGLATTWSELSTDPPTELTIVSPFWPEGKTASDALADLIQRLGLSKRVQLVCRGMLAPSGKSWLPVFDAEIASSLRKQLNGCLFLRAALPDSGVDADVPTEEEIGDETEASELSRPFNSDQSKDSDIHRSLHAKIILLDGPSGSVLYVGSSNCTRRGLGLGGPTNWESGFVYRLTRKQRRSLDRLLSFAGPPQEVLPDQYPKTQNPTLIKEQPAPSFITKITAIGTKVTIAFRENIPVPTDLVILMPLLTHCGDSSYYKIYDCEKITKPGLLTEIDLLNCPRCDEKLVLLATEPDDGPTLPHVFVEVRWQGHIVPFPVRFDEKATLPLLGRKPTEGELIDYFLYGRQPDDGEELTGDPAGNIGTHGTDSLVDTRRILAYFIRRFVQAIPGIEAEIEQASYSQTALNATLRGPTSPLELAERAFASLSCPPRPDEPRKTATAVGFQLTEILAVLLRCREHVDDRDLIACFTPSITRCQELLRRLADENSELEDKAFRRYQKRFIGDAP